MTLWWPAGFFALLLLTGATACHRAAYAYQPLPPPVAASGATAGPQLLFMSFNMTTDAAGGHHLAPLLVQAVPGQSNALAEEDVRDPSYLLVTQLGADGKACGPARRVPHPLVQDVEAPLATGELKRQLVVAPQAEFFVRLARLPQARSVRFEEAGPAAPKPLSVVFPLPN